jgi:serine protease Do
MPAQTRSQGQSQSQSQAPGQWQPVGSGSYLGIFLWEVDPARARDLRLPPDARVVVTLVNSGSPAEAAGLRAGDVVLEYDQKKIESTDQFTRLVRETPAGRTVRLRIVRNGVLQTLTAKIGSIPDAERPGPMVGTAPPQVGRQDMWSSLMTWNSSLLGVEAEPLFGQLADFFGVTQGVLVRSVTRGLPGEKAGLKAGDVILRVGKDEVTTPTEIAGRLRLAAAPTVKLTVVRDRREIVVTVTPE